MITRHFPVILNILWFQACWFACVMIGNQAAVVVLGLVICAYLLVPHLRSEIWLLIAICVLGFCVDSILINTGVLQHSSGGFLPPLWLSVLWLAFATTINHSSKPVMNNKILFMLLALVGGPLCYKVGVELSDIEFGFTPLISLSFIAAVWLLAGNLILILYDRWRNYVLS